MDTPATPYNVVLQAQATLNDKTVTFQEALPAHHWENLEPNAQEGIKNMVRRGLGNAIATSLNVPVTVTRGEPEVMRTSGAAPGHGGSVCVRFRPVSDAVPAEPGEVVDVPRVTVGPIASTAPLAVGLPHVRGRCPACGTASLFLAHGGYVTCAARACQEPDAASTDLEGPVSGEECRDAALNDGAAAVFALDFDLKRDGYEFDSHRQAWELGTIDAAAHLRSMTVRPVSVSASVERVERGRKQLVDAMSAVSEERHSLWWVEGLDRSLHGEGGMWETLGRAYGWPVGDFEKWTWRSWDEAGALYAERPAPGE